MRTLSATLATISLLLSGCTSRPDTAPKAKSQEPGARSRRIATFTDTTREAGIRFRHTSGASGRLYFPETMGSGGALLDYDGDGRLDLFLVNSTRLPGFQGKGPFYPALYRNRGDGAFVDVTKQAGLAVDCYGMGCAVGDYDNDGDPDLYVTAMGPNHLFANNGNGTFSDVTKQAGVGHPGFSTAAAWLDYDRDGDLDLFVGHYVVWTPQKNQICPDALGRKLMCRPSYYESVRPTLYRNDRAATFTDVSAASGLAGIATKVLGVAVWDEDGDGWPDLFLANDGERNLLYRNQKDGTFVERSLEAGVALGASGMARAGMGVDTGDWENSGAEGIVIGNFAREGTALYRPNTPGHYVDVAAERSVLEPSMRLVTFGTLFVDVDLDGWKDLVTTSGHVEPNQDRMGDGISFAQPLLLFHGDGAGGFRDVTAESGPGFQGRMVGRGIASGDIDGDGDPDLLITTNGGVPRLLRNDALRSPLSALRVDGGSSAADRQADALAESREQRAESTPHWLAIRAVGGKSPRDGIGTKVVVRVGETRQQGWIRSGSSYLSSSELVARFGLGPATQADEVIVTFASGVTKTIANVAAGQVLFVRE